MTRKLRVAAVVAGLVALAIAAAAVALDRSLPYRIGPANYARYLWVGRLAISALIACLFAMGLGFAWRQRFLVIVGVCGVLAALSIGGIHAGANPATWCYNNLRAIDAAKQELAYREARTNEAAITAAEVALWMDRRLQSLRCYEGGVYVIGPVGTEARCSVHGSLSDIIGDTPNWTSPETSGIQH